MRKSIATVAAVFVAAISGTAIGHTGGSAPPLRPIVCFPAKDWGPAPKADRPCVWKLYEDGSVDVRQRDGGRVAADD